MNNPVEGVFSHLRRTGNTNGIKHDAQIESMDGSTNISLDDDDDGYASDDLRGRLRMMGDIPPGRHKGRKKRMFRIKKKKALTPLHNDDFAQGGEAKVSDVVLDSFAITRKQRRSPLLGKGVVESSNIQLTSTMSNKLPPALSMFATKAVDGLLGGVHKHMQGPFALDIDGTNNSPLASPILTPNLYSNISTPFNMSNGMPTAPAPMPPPNQGAQVPLPTAPPQPPTVAPAGSAAASPAAAPVASATASPTIPAPVATAGVPPPPRMQLPPNAMAYPQMSMQNVMSANQMAQNPAFNIHPTATNLRDDPGNVNYNEVVTITIGIVICLFLFCFVFGCAVKMCKPGKRRR
ncbi:hypothetical protein C922_04208 [Plasmodium inui San Antonio 1]|uniref:Uncharacterized protein n=1 Tax=Plasmodium inui San Antonio 1 TaxID=1237626 RepID=W7A287_9APIC|nr:hypothetical protein C922_04208 [Plasmodium inui San Antonio 1]EUD65468.1 hypothetical protein C922_04208 [Plasmodium inui San Antonio 1]